jgi:anaerobic ribonucleoside-triphosphate reductase activating protein
MSTQLPQSHLRLNAAAHGLRGGVLGATDHRVMLTLQGCSHTNCPGCTSPHTWDANGGRLFPIKGLIRWMKSLPRIGGLTVTGGEPSDQADALAHLLREFRTRFPHGEVVLYSALLWPKLQRNHAHLVGLCDVVVAGPYVSSLPPSPLAGSSNQTVHLLTPMAERLYADWKNWPLHRMQVGQLPQEKKVLMVGIPSRAMSNASTASTLV